jgi:hypothetical protein
MKRIAIAVACALLASSQVQGPNAQAHSSATGAEPSSQASSADWAVYHGNPHGTHYSTLENPVQPFSTQRCYIELGACGKMGEITIRQPQLFF